MVSILHSYLPQLAYCVAPSESWQCGVWDIVLGLGRCEHGCGLPIHSLHIPPLSLSHSFSLSQSHCSLSYLLPLSLLISLTRCCSLSRMHLSLVFSPTPLTCKVIHLTRSPTLSLLSLSIHVPVLTCYLSLTRCLCHSLSCLCYTRRCHQFTHSLVLHT